jgi:hypothetical protein
MMCGACLNLIGQAPRESKDENETSNPNLISDHN